MRICFASSECVPFVKTGGLADVSGALPKALAALGHEVKVFLPLYDSINTLDHKLEYSQDLQGIPLSVGDQQHSFNCWYRQDPDGVTYHLIDCPHFFHRGQVYTNHEDEHQRFILFQDAILSVLQRYAWAPEILHCNDWQTALLPVFIREKYDWDGLFQQTATVLSIHNIGYQGLFSKQAVSDAGLPESQFYAGGPFEFNNAFSFLKAGIVYADVLSTVSPTYAQEIQGHVYGAGLEGLLAARSEDLAGILNGIDVDIWNPGKDEHIEQKFTWRSLKRKAVNKQALLDIGHLGQDDGAPLIGMITRLAVQKGLDIFAPIFSELASQDVKFALLGSGEQQYEDFMRWAAHTWPDKVFAYVGYNNPLAHKITAGADMFLMPSHYEPCGLNQMYSLRYGTIPIVRKTGGLADTVQDFHEYYPEGNGISFVDYTAYALKVTVERALGVFQQKGEWNAMMLRGMKADFSWKHSAGKYVDLYQQALTRKAR